MPITGPHCLHPINQEEFAELDYRVMRIACESEGTSHHENHLRAMLRLSPLRTLQWVNLGRQKIQLVSLTR